MKVVTPEISWHGKDAIFSIDVQCVIKRQPRRFATAGLDTNIRVCFLICIQKLVPVSYVASPFILCYSI